MNFVQKVYIKKDSSRNYKRPWMCEPTKGFLWPCFGKTPMEAYNNYLRFCKVQENYYNSRINK